MWLHYGKNFAKLSSLTRGLLFLATGQSRRTYFELQPRVHVKADFTFIRRPNWPPIKWPVISFPQTLLSGAASLLGRALLKFDKVILRVKG